MFIGYFPPFRFHYIKQNGGYLGKAEIISDYRNQMKFHFRKYDVTIVIILSLYSNLKNSHLHVFP